MDSRPAESPDPQNGKKQDLDYLFAKRSEWKLHQLKMLSGKRDTDNGKAKDKCKNKMDKGGIETPTDKPDYIKQNIQTSRTRIIRGKHFFTKWPEHKTCNLKTLQAPGDSYYGNA